MFMFSQQRRQRVLCGRALSFIQVDHHRRRLLSFCPCCTLKSVLMLPISSMFVNDASAELFCHMVELVIASVASITYVIESLFFSF